MTNKIRIVNRSDKIDNINYEYAMCECCMFSERVEIPRPECSGVLLIRCPRCGSTIRIGAVGKMEAESMWS